MKENLDLIFEKYENVKLISFKENEGSYKLIIQVPKAFAKKRLEDEIKAVLEGKVNFVFYEQEEVTGHSFKKIIGVSSGKGGVGKSSISLHLAFALKEMGYKVGLLDADIYGPSIPVFLNINEKPTSLDGRTIQPIETHGFQVLSMGLFLDNNQAAIWRGPMLVSAFTQFLEQGNWDCDYLIVDFPPGTGELHMTCSKIAPDLESLIVTIPSKVSYADAFKMFVTLKTMDMKILGFVENMASFACKSCGNLENLSKNNKIDNLDMLSSMPFFSEFFDLNESGYPSDYKQGVESSYFKSLAEKIINS
jgi:ATP-binding protein involved in chromosome partitioning